jgi:glycosyltransferase involved in cell wall biosynthesis
MPVDLLPRFGPQSFSTDIFVDLSGCSLPEAELSAHLSACVDAISPTQCVTVAVGSIEGAGRRDQRSRFDIFDGPPAEALRYAVRAAADRRRALVIVRGLWMPSGELLGGLADLVSLDPLIGSFQPRFAASDDEGIWILPSETGEGANERMPRKFLPLLPEILITPELYAACILLSPAAVLAADVPALDTIDAAVALTLVSLRRRGFRNVVSNRLVATSTLARDVIYPRLNQTERQIVTSTYPDVGRAATWRDRLPQRRFEEILSGSFSADGRPRLLIDCRGMQPGHNGTAHSMLGYLKGLQELSPGWDIEVAVQPAAAAFHRVYEVCNRLRVNIGQPMGPYLASVTLNQPFSLEVIAELHRVSCLLVHNMLDTIAWDIIWQFNDRLGSVWDFIARYADGLIFISKFSQDRFTLRFSPSPEVRQTVAHLSFCPEETAGSDGQAFDREPYILLVGNEYDHKDIGRTLGVLVDAFPFTRTIVIGSNHAPSANVTAMPSGYIDPAELHRLFIGAAVIVFPSFYEGFGLPPMYGLARGRTVAVRKSEIWNEIAAHTRTVGALVPFEDDADLTEVVGRALHGLPPKGLPQGGLIPANGSPAKWRDCAGRIIELLEQLRSNISYRRWRERDSAIDLMNSQGT